MVGLAVQKETMARKRKATGVKLPCLFVRYSNGYQPVSKELKIERGNLRGTEIVNAIIGIGEAYGFETEHALQVTRLALRLFDELQPLHGMGNTERIWLRAAAMLHDVGKARGPEGPSQSGARDHRPFLQAPF